MFRKSDLEILEDYGNGFLLVKQAGAVFTIHKKELTE